MTPPDQPSVIEIDDLWFSYNATTLFQGVSLTIDEGDFACMVGPNGGGKTTLLKLILGLLRPRRGTVRVLGRAPRAARPWIGYVPQSVLFDVQFPMNVMDVTLMGRLGRTRLVGSYRRKDRDAVRSALAKVGLEDSPDRPFADLSGGQRQRVLIARALACNPKILLLDEPTANLDVEAEREFFDVLQRLNEELTIVLVSHDVGFVSQFVSRVVCVHHGVSIHPTEELTGETITELYSTAVRLIRHDKHASESEQG